MEGKKIIGIVGGMGPMTTVALFRMIVEHTKGETDQDHIRILIDNHPQIPDRTKAILSGGPSPVPQIVSSAKTLEAAGADFLIIPCNTSHYFLQDVQRQCRVPILNMIEETARLLASMNVKKAGLLATTGTIRGGVYDKFMRPYGIQLLCPDGEDQQAVMDFIYKGVKSGNDHYDPAAFMRAVGHMADQGAETMILGCTEIPVGMKMYRLSFPFVDALETLAKAAVSFAGYEVREG